VSIEGGQVVTGGNWTTYTPPEGEDPEEDQFVFRVQNALGGWADGMVTILRDDQAGPDGDTLIISGVSVQGNGLSFSIHGTPGRRFDLESTTDLVTPDWQKIGEITIGEGGHALLLHEDAGPVQFYRTIRRED
jgi:hypothetical protein